MRIFKSGTEGLEHWLCYDEPGYHLVNLSTTTNSKHGYKNHIFELAFPGIVFYSSSMNGKISSDWPSVWVARRCPILKSGNVSKAVKLNIIPLGHCYDWGNCCIYNNKPRPNIQMVFIEFWESIATYFVEGKVANWVAENFKKDLTGTTGQWRYFNDIQFFEKWEKKYNLKNISKAPFMNLESEHNVSYQRSVDLRAIGRWEELVL